MGNCVDSTITIQIGKYAFTPSHVIGSGHSGTVCKGYLIGNRQLKVAIKCLHRKFTPEEANQMRPILTQLEQVEGEHITKYIDHYYDQETSNLYLISEYCAFGNLGDLIFGGLKIDPVEDLRSALSYCQQIIRALLDLHSKNIVHGKLNLKNVLVQGSKLKINDFGLDRILRKEGEIGEKKPSVYDAPELQDELVEPSEVSDIWSLGIVMYHLVYKTNPLKIMRNEYVFYDFKSGKCPTFDGLVKKCLEINPDLRISSEDLRRHPFLSFNPSEIEFLPNKWNKCENPSPLSAYQLFHKISYNSFSDV